MAQSDIASRFYQNHDHYRETALTHRRFKHADLQPLISKLAPPFKVTHIGNSTENRPIHLIKVGKGKTRILFWSQMHGDEATATMVMFDIFNFFARQDEFDRFRKEILENVALYFIPMLNPDGAELFQRRNALDIDLNRDAMRLQSPEARLLNHVRDTIKPDFGFNLHDQSTQYTVGNTSKPATISFLAPPYNYAKSVNDVRSNAIKLIVELTEVLSRFIPGQIGKYSDEYEPRAFGDNMQKWGTSTVLLESGGYAGDPEKQYIRRLKFTALMTAIHSISKHQFEKYSTEHYNRIPPNTRFMRDVILRELGLRDGEREYKVDVAFEYKEINTDNCTSFYYRNQVDDIGDLSVLHGYEEYDCRGMVAEAGKVYPHILDTPAALAQLDIQQLYREGYTAVKVRATGATSHIPAVPVDVLFSDHEPNWQIRTGANPSFVIRDHDKVRYVVINGFVHEVESGKGVIRNALFYT